MQPLISIPDDFDPELYFISGKIFDINIQKEWEYLYHYFKTATQRAFVRYYLTYGNFTRFVDHTGYSCSANWMTELHKQLQKLIEAKEKAKAEGDFATISLLESGKYELEGDNYAE